MAELGPGAPAAADVLKPGRVIQDEIPVPQESFIGHDSGARHRARTDRAPSPAPPADGLAMPALRLLSSNTSTLLASPTSPSLYLLGTRGQRKAFLGRFRPRTVASDGRRISRIINDFEAFVPVSRIPEGTGCRLQGAEAKADQTQSRLVATQTYSGTKSRTSFHPPSTLQRCACCWLTRSSTIAPSPPLTSQEHQHVPDDEVIYLLPSRFGASESTSRTPTPARMPSSFVFGGTCTVCRPARHFTDTS